jgi:cell division protein ZapA
MEHLTVTILDREYRLACTPDERDALLRSAAYVDSKMQAIRSGGKVMGADRIAVMAALQITHELFSARSADGVDLGELRRRVRDLLHTAEDALLPQEKLF